MCRGHVSYNQSKLKVLHFNVDRLETAGLDKLEEQFAQMGLHIIILVGTRNLGSGHSIGKHYHHWRSGPERANAQQYSEGIRILVTRKDGLGASVGKCWKPWSPRLLQVRIRHPQLDCVITGAYAVPNVVKIGLGRKYPSASAHQKQLHQFWDELGEALNVWPARVTHVCGIDANARVGAIPGPGIGPLHPEEVNTNGERLMDVLRQGFIAANTYRCDSTKHGTWFCWADTSWKRIDYLVVSKRLWQQDLISSVEVQPVKGLGRQLDHCPILAKLDLRISLKYQPPPSGALRYDRDKLGNPHLQSLFRLTMEAEVEAYSTAQGLDDLRDSGAITEEEASRIAWAAGERDLVSVRSGWLELTLQQWADYFFNGRGPQAPTLWMNWTHDFQDDTKTKIEEAWEASYALACAARAAIPGVRISRHGGQGTLHKWMRNIQPASPGGPAATDAPALPAQPDSPIGDLSVLMERAATAHRAKKRAVKKDRIAKVEAISREVSEAKSIWEKTRCARALFRDKSRWGPATGTSSASTESPEDRLKDLAAHLSLPPRNAVVVDSSPPSLAEEALAEIHHQEAPVRAAPSITTDQVSLGIKGEKRNKSCLRGTVPSDVLKLGGDSFVAFLAVMFNLACAFCFLPFSAKDSTTLPIPKDRQGGSVNWEKCRFICLLHRVWTVLAGILAFSLRKAALATEHGLDVQFGFLPGRSTITLLLTLRAILYQLQLASTSAVIISLDLAKAFDSLKRDSLAQLLQDMGVKLGWAIVAEMFHNETYYSIQCLETGRTLRLLIPRGVRQGSREGPIIFVLIYAAVLAELGAALDINEEKITAKWVCMETGEEKTFDLTFLLFADDSTVILRDTSTAFMTQFFQALVDVYADFGLSLNWGKTLYQLALHGKGASSREEGHPAVGGELEIRLSNGAVHRIKRVRVVKTMGQMISWKSAEYGAEIARRRNLATAAAAKIGARFWSNVSLPLKTRVRFWKAYVRATLIYALETVGQLSEAQLGALERCQGQQLGRMCRRKGELRCALTKQQILAKTGVHTIASVLRMLRLRLYGTWARGELPLATGATLIGTSLIGEPGSRSFFECSEFGRAVAIDLGKLPELDATAPGTENSEEDWRSWCASFDKTAWQALCNGVLTTLHVTDERDGSCQCPHCEHPPFQNKAGLASHVKHAHKDLKAEDRGFWVHEAIGNVFKQRLFSACPACGRPFDVPAAVKCEKDYRAEKAAIHNHIFSQGAKANSYPQCGQALVDLFSHLPLTLPAQPLVPTTRCKKAATMKWRKARGLQGEHDFVTSARLVLGRVQAEIGRSGKKDIRSFFPQRRPPLQ